MKATIPRFLSYRTAADLVRVGRDYDGGYLVSEADINQTDFLVGLGINDDWSFEAGFISRKAVPLRAYDASVSGREFFKRIIKSIPRLLYKPQNFFHWIKVFLAYQKFFSGDRQHLEKFVGLEASDNQIGMSRIFESINSNNLFLKIDIEGAEYRILDSLIENADRITGLAIEFHDLDLHFDRIQKFITSFPLPLVHIHANNGGAITKEHGTPLVVEFTFSANAALLDQTLMPHPLDMQNEPRLEEISLSFEAE